MILSIDLTPRQAQRVIQQALRARAEVQIEPRVLPEGATLAGVIEDGSDTSLAIRISRDSPVDDICRLIGSFCEVRTNLSGQLYVFTTTILAVREQPHVSLQLAMPESVQVVNRRQYERTNTTVASQMRIWTDSESQASTGLLTSVAPGGIGARLPFTDAPQEYYIGDRVRVRFEIAGFDDQFELDAVVCNRLVHDASQELELGLEFAGTADDPAATRTLTRIRSILSQLTSDLP
ncbi:MAG: PilZ domain-containing protein [Planctomycetota bacterium]|nr:MAG: PilZ domain-containing protein [Planctomycetota bacterium]